MQIYTNNNSSFPDQVVPDAVKETWEYGKKVAWAIEGDFKKMNAEDFKKSYRDYTEGQDLQADQKFENYVQNNYRMLGEAGMIALHYAMGLLFASMFADDDDSSELETRAENLLMYQVDRTWKELITFVPLIGMQQQYQMVKSPIASTRTMGELGQAIALTITTPIAMLAGADESDSSIYYQRGSRAGELKLKKEWMDAIPVDLLIVLFFLSRH